MTVWDDNRDHKYSFLGKVSDRAISLENLPQVCLPLLGLEQGRRWYRLKDRYSRGYSRGYSRKYCKECSRGTAGGTARGTVESSAGVTP